MQLPIWARAWAFEGGFCMDQKGVFYAALSYFLWGVLPVYWKMIDHVPSGEILANRIFWSFVFMAALIVFSGKLPAWKETVMGFRKRPERGIALAAASFILSVNWFIFIWAVNHGHVVESSLGYYINPLISIVLGILVLKEKLNGAQVLSVLLASAGVLVLTVSYGQFPWISMGLALTFGVYGLLKKMVNVDSSVGLAVETMTVCPFAIGYILYLIFHKESSFSVHSLSTDLFLILTGPATALPLLFFAKGAQRISMFMLGILQYIAPTLMLLLGVFFYHEPFTAVHFWAFLFIWTALAIVVLSQSRGTGLFERKPLSR